MEVSLDIKTHEKPTIVRPFTKITRTENNESNEPAFIFLHICPNEFYPHKVSAQICAAALFIIAITW